MPEREPLKFRIKLVAIGFLFFGLAMFAWAALLVLGLSMEVTREKLLEGAPVHLVAPGVAFLATCALSTAIGLLRRAEWSYFSIGVLPSQSAPLVVVLRYLGQGFDSLGSAVRFSFLTLLGSVAFHAVYPSARWYNFRGVNRW